MYLLSDVSIDYADGPSDTVVDENSVIQKVLVVFGTPIGSRKRYEDFGCSVVTQLFEPFDSVTAGWIGTSLREAIDNQANELSELITEFRVSVSTDKVTQTYFCQCTFRIKLPSAEANRQLTTLNFNLSPQGNALALPTRQLRSPQ